MTAEPPTDQPEPLWAIVELMGHTRLAGQVAQDSTLAPGLVRVDVPATSDAPAFTKYIAPGAIYAITPVTEATGRRAAALFRARPILVYGLDQPAALPAPDEDPDPDEWDDA